MKFFKRKTKEAPPQQVTVPAADESVVPAPEPEPVAAPAPVAEQPTPEPEPREQAATRQETKSGFFSRLRRGLGRTSDNLVQGMGTLFLGRKEIDIDLIEELESRLLQMMRASVNGNR